MGYNYYPHWTIKLGDGHIPVTQPYEPIRIKWDTGFMDVVPPGVFEIESASSCTSKFRNLLKLCVKSDIVYGTNTISAWRKAIKADLDFLLMASDKIADRYQELYEDIVDSSEQADKNRASKLRNLQKRNTIELKRLDARRKRVIKCSQILEEYVNKYM